MIKWKNNQKNAMEKLWSNIVPKYLMEVHDILNKYGWLV